MINTALFSSDKQDWETPQELFDELNNEFNFTIDVAANESNAKCKRFYTEAENRTTTKLERTNGMV